MDRRHPDAPSPEAAILDLAAELRGRDDLPDERWLLRFIRSRNAGVTLSLIHI